MDKLCWAIVLSTLIFLRDPTFTHFSPLVFVPFFDWHFNFHSNILRLMVPLIEVFPLDTCNDSPHCQLPSTTSSPPWCPIVSMTHLDLSPVEQVWKNALPKEHRARGFATFTNLMSCVPNGLLSWYFLLCKRATAQAGAKLSCC
jgi:hypothetical protein